MMTWLSIIGLVGLGLWIGVMLGAIAMAVVAMNSDPGPDHGRSLPDGPFLPETFVVKAPESEEVKEKELTP